MTLYEELVAAGCKIDHHESNLYVRDCIKFRAIIIRHRQLPGSTLPAPKPFTCSVDGTVWLDIPFAYDPFFNKSKN